MQNEVRGFNRNRGDISSDPPVKSKNRNSNSDAEEPTRALARGKTWRKELVSHARNKEKGTKVASKETEEDADSGSQTSFRREFSLPPI